jgi:hypothetical protein
MHVLMCSYIFYPFLLRITHTTTWSTWKATKKKKKEQHMVKNSSEHQDSRHQYFQLGVVRDGKTNIPTVSHAHHEQSHTSSPRTIGCPDQVVQFQVPNKNTRRVSPALMYCVELCYLPLSSAIIYSRPLGLSLAYWMLHINYFCWLQKIYF